MYTVWKRTAAPPTMLLFDAPNREVCTVRRSRTNTPLQALALLNEFTYVEAARHLAQRMLTEGGSTAEGILALGFRSATARAPTMAEQRILSTIREQALVRFRADRNAARKLLAVGESPRDKTLDEVELAAWSTVASVILNLDETISRR